MGGVSKVVVLAAMLAPVVVAAQDGSGATKGVAGWPVVAEKSNTDALSFTRETLARIHHTNQLEAQVGALAQERGSTPEVRRFGRILVVDHARADRELLEYAQRRRGVAIGPPQVVMEAERDQLSEKAIAIQELKLLTGPAFDAQFLNMMTEEHETAIQALQNARAMVEDPQLRTILRKVLPILRQHLWIAQSLATQSQPTS